MKMKRRLITVTLLCVGLLVSGCSGTADRSEPTVQPKSENANAVEPLEIRLSSTFQQTETGGELLSFFADQVGVLSEGAITVQTYWGGTLFTAQDELDAVIDNAVDMVALAHMPHLNTVTYLAFPGFAPGGPEVALEYFDDLVFKNAETSALIQGEAEALGIKYLNVIAGGANAFCAKYDFDDLDSLVRGSSSFGNMDAAMFEHLGFQVTSLFPPETYDALGRGLVDATQMALKPMVAMSWYEPAPYWALDGTYTAGNFFTVNLDWWNGLSEGQREIIQAAAQETQQYSGGLYTDEIADDVAMVVEKTGNEFVEFTKADIDQIWMAVFESKADSALRIAESAGKVDGMVTILQRAAALTGYEWEYSR
ncbi:TRAP transporter substrate-binding protein [Anoxynatronum buryatiense]|uniref:TRAP-type C4-dicarboxylate transport system, substrate-binding protein n=1 Tax=Anoxynatronum buryatiense TaxID=489973 RepID=A0AA45WYC0_9CLOT|nr:TRAP transporter substrate-binding protein DctP [Anoxynatronum buryatiense]SMP68269.1 TRAP-type C4-dicarboxylate transport system, substrate-binding protein [Anoxynatronum buryatiense]